MILGSGVILFTQCILSNDIIFSKEDTSMEEIQRMQDNLLLIRRAIGWTASEFGDQICFTLQTINNIES